MDSRDSAVVGCDYCWELAAAAVGRFVGLSNLCVWAMYLARAFKGSGFVRRQQMFRLEPPVL